MQHLQSQFQLFGIMGCFILGNTEIVLCLRRGICFGIANENFQETLYGLFEAIKIEFNLPLAEKDLCNEILRRKISDKTMVLLALRI